MALADQTFGFFIPTVSLMGVGSAKDAGAQAKALGATNLLIVTDAGLAKLGVADKIKKLLVDAGLKATIYSGAEPNPTDKNVHDGVKAYKENKCDGIVSLGGGSSHDCGKGIGLGSFQRRQHPRLRRRRQVHEAHASVSCDQHHRWYRERNDPLLHHHQHRYAREDGHR